MPEQRDRPHRVAVGDVGPRPHRNAAQQLALETRADKRRLSRPVAPGAIEALNPVFENAQAGRDRKALDFEKPAPGAAFLSVIDGVRRHIANVRECATIFTGDDAALRASAMTSAPTTCASNQFFWIKQACR